MITCRDCGTQIKVGDDYGCVVSITAEKVICRSCLLRKYVITSSFTMHLQVYREYCGHLDCAVCEYRFQCLTEYYDIL